uniref:Uncharacterized protein n=1 Tax=Arundo donax TaxID=35708 RepID=A0A0A8ZMD5_ARUDO
MCLRCNTSVQNCNNYHMLNDRSP